MTVEWEDLLWEVGYAGCPGAFSDAIAPLLRFEGLDLFTTTFRRLLLEKIVCINEFNWEGLIYSCQMHKSEARFPFLLHCHKLPGSGIF